LLPKGGTPNRSDFSDVGFYDFLTSFVHVFISPPSETVRGCIREETKLVRKHMADLVYIGMVVLFFVVSGLYIGACERM